MSTPPDSEAHSPAADAVSASLPAGPEPLSKPLSPGTKRARRHRKRRRQGFRSVRVLVNEKDIEAMVRLGYLKEHERGDPEALGMAVYCAADMALDETKNLIARGIAQRVTPPDPSLGDGPSNFGAIFFGVALWGMGPGKTPIWNLAPPRDRCPRSGGGSRNSGAILS
jgi:hypothetical protein